MPTNTYHTLATSDGVMLDRTMELWTAMGSALTAQLTYNLLDSSTGFTISMDERKSNPTLQMLSKGSTALVAQLHLTFPD
jgi:hypothetical protein